ncbi:hypothetical protein F4777DRAFT_590873 [Nemania sp. FL0916]|nr:hypothetical protein F4777DRAFT_590873 [Nemania sp. FL0916]
MAVVRFASLLGLLIPCSLALLVTPNSPCASFCLDSSDNISNPNSYTTTNKEITCRNSDYTSQVGQKFEQCMSCLQDSTFSQGDETDQLWFLYNLRYAFDNCIFGFPNVTDNPSTPCTTSTACGALELALTQDKLSATHPDYSYCDADGGVMTSDSITKCISCVGASEDQGFLVNYLVALEAGCDQRPAPGTAVGLSDTVFSTTQITAIEPTSAASNDNKSALPITSIVGIAVGAVVVLLAIAGFFFVRHRKRRNQRRRFESEISNAGSPRRANHRPASSLSFRCQTHLTPRSPAFFPNDSDTTVEEEKGYSSPDLALGSHPITKGSPMSNPSSMPWHDQPSAPSFSRPRPAPQPLHNISTTTPTVPESVHYSTSPKASRFPTSYEETPTSTTSTRSTAQLLPLRAYNPADYGVASPHLGSPAADGSSSYTSPISASTASPLLGRTWERQNVDSSSMTPLWETQPPLPLRETVVTAAARSSKIGMPPLSPGKKRISSTGSGSPVESTQINTVFPGPPSPGARWRR